MTNRSGCLCFAPHPFPAPRNSGDSCGPRWLPGADSPAGTDRQTLALSACPQPGSSACRAAAGEALAGPGQSSELAAPSPPGFHERPGPGSGDGGDGSPAARGGQAGLRAAPSTSPTCIPRPFCLLAARPCVCVPRPRPVPWGCCGRCPGRRGRAVPAVGPAGQAEVKGGRPLRAERCSR